MDVCTADLVVESIPILKLIATALDSIEVATDTLELLDGEFLRLLQQQLVNRRQTHDSAFSSLLLGSSECTDAVQSSRHATRRRTATDQPGLCSTSSLLFLSPPCCMCQMRAGVSSFDVCILQARDSGEPRVVSDHDG